MFVLQAVERSADGDKSVRVANRWPIEAEATSDAMDFIDRTPPFGGWGKVHRFEVLDDASVLLASRGIEPGAKWILAAEAGAPD